MIFNIGDSIYLEVEDLEKKGIARKRVKTAINHFNKQRRDGKPTESWSTISHPDHGKKILVKYNSISQSFFEKYNLPSEEDIKQQIAVKNFEQTEEKKRNVTEGLQEALKHCFSKRYLDYYPEYFKQFNGNSKKATKYARNHAVFSFLVDLYTNSDFNALKEAFELYKKLNLPSTCSNFISFKRKLIKIEAEGIQNVLINKLNGKQSNRKITSNFHIAVVERLYADPHKYKQEHIYSALQAACVAENKPTPSFSWLKGHLSKPDVKNRLCEFRYGMKVYNDTVSAYMPRNKAINAGDLYMMDGTPIQFQCFDEEGKNVIRLNLYVVLDAHSGKITGFDLSLSEDKHAVINSLQRAFNLHGHLPAEILHDNFSATKTDEFKSLAEKLKIMGVLLRAAKVGNPADKANVERYFGTFQSKYCTLIDGYLGEGITSKRKDARANPEFLKKVYDKGLPNIHEMKYRIIELINMYNVCKNLSGECPSEIYSTSQKPNVKLLDKAQLSILFWKEKEVKVSRSMVKITVRKTEYTYEIYDNDLKNKLNGKQIKCLYDEADMSSVHLFTIENSSFICECNANYKPHQAQINQSEEDKTKILQYDAKKKSHRLHNHRTTEEIQNAGALETTDNELKIESPFTIYKEAANQSEHNELSQLLAMQSNIDFTKVSEYKPIESKMSFLSAGKTSINSALNEKIFKQKASLKPFNPDEESEF